LAERSKGNFSRSQTFSFPNSRLGMQSRNSISLSCYGNGISKRRWLVLVLTLGDHLRNMDCISFCRNGGVYATDQERVSIFSFPNSCLRM
jgi:hypothetical protein